MKKLLVFLAAMTLCYLVGASALSANSGTTPEGVTVESQDDASVGATREVGLAASTSSESTDQESVRPDGETSQLDIFGSFKNKLDVMVTAELQGCSIRMCETHADCGAGISCYRCCYGICMND